ncbi:MAG: ABC transporter ATP-binding protein, partial [Chloroflexota bacterium]
MENSNHLTSEYSLPEEYQVPGRITSRRDNPLAWLLAHFTQYWYLGLTTLIGAIGNASLAAVVPVIVGRALNALQDNPPKTELLLNFALIIVVTQVIRGALQLGRNFSAELLGQLMERDIRHELYTSLLGKSMTYHSLLPVGDVMARSANDVREINFMFSPGFNLVVGSANFIIMPIIFSYQYHPSLIIPPLIFLVLYIVALWQYLYELQPITDSVRKAFGTLNSRLSEAVDGIETVKGMAEEESEINLFANNARRFMKREIHQGDVEARFVPLLVMGLTQAGGLFQAVFLFQRGLIEVGDIAAFFGLMG